jgi:hypothetical protein
MAFIPPIRRSAGNAVVSLALMVLFVSLSPIALAADRPSRSDMAFGPMLRAVHMGGNWWTNTCFSEGVCPTGDDPGLGVIPQGYIDFLNSVHTNWIGISVALFLDDVSDATVERRYAGGWIRTWTDDQFRTLIQRFHDAGFLVYVTLAFEEAPENPEQAREDTCNSANYNAPRWQWGDTNAANDDPCVAPAHWRWDPAHPEHAAYVAQFWQSYTAEAVHFAQILEQENVELYSLGTETENLFRSRPGGGFPQHPNHFKTELRAMLAAVREQYHGLITYDQHSDSLEFPDAFGPGVTYLWDDVDFDVIGLSAYFRLASSLPTTVMTHSQLTDVWEDIFENYLIPLKNRYPDRAIVFTEFGYTHAVGSPFDPQAEAFSPYVFADADNNGKDDGEETQSNIYASFFNVSRENAGVVKGAFFWGQHIASDEGWANSYAMLRNNHFRGRFAEDAVRSNYANPIPQPRSAFDPSAIILLLLAD